MARALVQSTNLSSAVGWGNNGQFEGSTKTGKASTMLCSVQSSPIRMRSFTGLGGANALDIMVQKSGHTRQSKVASVGKRGKKLRMAPRAMSEQFTEKAIEVIILAQEEARRLGHNFVGTKQITEEKNEAAQSQDFEEAGELRDRELDILIYTSKLLSFKPPQSLSPPTTETQTPYLQNDTTSRTKIIHFDFVRSPSFLNSHQLFVKIQFPLLFLGLSSPLSCLASDSADLPTEQVSNKIDLESVLVSIDNFFNRYPFFVATVAFVWLVAIPLIEEYLQKYKYIAAINAFKKLQDDPNCQLLDIRESRGLAYLPSPNLKMLNKSAVQVEFREGEEEGFVKRVLENFVDPANTAVCVVDNFDGNSLKVAELLVKNGFKEAYAIRGGIRGKKGWQEIQETLLPPFVRVYPREKAKKLKHVNKNSGMSLQDGNMTDGNSTLPGSNANNTSEGIKNEKASSVGPGTQSKGQRPLSPYPNYPDWRPPSSPTPSKPT